MSQIYVIVTNASSVVVGKNVYNDSGTITVEQGKYPLLTFTTVDQSTFDGTAFVGPNYLMRS